MPAATLSKTASGFTLVELILVIAIISTLSAIAIPRYANSINNYRVACAVRRVEADLYLARARARALSTSQSVDFSVSQNRYQLTGFIDPDRPGQTYAVDFNDQTTSCTLVSAVFGTGSTMTFSGFGIPASGGTLQIRSGTASRTMTIDADTGNVSVQ